LKGDLQRAIETHEVLYNVAKKYKFLPEVNLIFLLILFIFIYSFINADPFLDSQILIFRIKNLHSFFFFQAFTTNMDLYWAQHPLRPEFIESTYFLYQVNIFRRLIINRMILKNIFLF